MTVEEYNKNNLGFRLIPKNSKSKNLYYRLEQYCDIAGEWVNCITPGMKTFQLDNGKLPEIFLRDRVNKNDKYLIVYKTEHYISYYQASTTEQIGRCCLKLLKDRMEFEYCKMENTFTRNAKLAIKTTDYYLAHLLITSQEFVKGFSIEIFNKV